MSGGTTTTTQQTEQQRAPWAPAMPNLQSILTNSMQAYNSGQGSQVYQGDRVADPSAYTQAGMNYLAQNAGAGLGTAQAGNDYTRQLLNQGGSTAGTRQATNGLLGVGTVDTGGLQQVANRLSNPNNPAARASDALMGDRFNLDASGFNRLNQNLAGPTQVQQSLQAVANGRYLGEANPYTSQMIDNAQADAANRVKNTFAASGRYGSGMFSSALGDTVARVGTELRYKDYDAERARQAAAAQAIDQGLLARTGARQSLYTSANDTRTGNANQMLQGAQLGLAGNAAALQGQQALAAQQQANNQQQLAQYGTALQGAQSDRSAALGGVSALPTLQNAFNAPGQTLLGIGTMQEQQRQRELAAQQDYFNETQNAPWRQLGLLSGTTLPIAGLGGTSSGTTVTEQPQPGLLQQILGGATAGVGLLGQTGAFGPAGYVTGMFR